jgi:hypothetical protein
MLALFFARCSSRSMTWLLATALLGLAVAAGCATGGSNDVGEAFYAGGGSARVNPILPRDQARIKALEMAELQARDRVREKVLHARLADGRVVGDMAAADPFARAVVMDAVRAAPIKERVFTEDVGASITVKLEFAPIRKMLSEKPASAAR